MFDKYGEFDSVEELNAKAEELLDTKDTDGIYVLAAENGIDKMDADDFVNGDVGELATCSMAAVGKIEVESKKCGINGILDDWKNELVNMCMDNEEMQRAVRKKGKSVAEFMSKLIRFAFENKCQVSNEIVKITKVTHNGKEEPFKGALYLGIPNRKQVKEIAVEYYKGDVQK